VLRTPRPDPVFFFVVLSAGPVAPASLQTFALSYAHVLARAGSFLDFDFSGVH